MARSFQLHQWRTTRLFRRTKLRVQGLALLLGMTAGWLITAVVTRFTDVFSDTSFAEILVVSGMLFGLAIGPYLPRRLAAFLASFVWRQRRRQDADPRLAVDMPARRTRPGTAGLARVPGARESNPADQPALRDRRLLWMIIGTLALASGLGVALLPVCIGGAERLYDLARSRFLWMPASLAVLTMLTTFLTCVLPCGLMGFVFACLHHLDRSDGRWSPVTTPWILIGVSVGVGGASAFACTTVRPNLAILVASLPLFVIAIIAARRTDQRKNLGFDSPSPAAMPEIALQAPAALRNVALCAVASISCTIVVLSGGLTGDPAVGRATPNKIGFGVHSTPYTLLGAATVGLLIEGRRAVIGSTLVGGLGLHCALAGIVGIAASGAATGRRSTATAADLVLNALAYLAIATAAFVLGRANRLRVAGAVATGAEGARQLSSIAWVPAAFMLVLAMFSPGTGRR
ncbi:MAG: hypothetical protein IID39_06535 [Planctomycetes bacterium]|nr:hypothetical protein [Planctomycetota bacterium]